MTKYARQTGLVEKLAPHDMRRNLREIMPRIRRGPQADPISAGPRLDPDDRTLLGIAAEFEGAVNDRLGLDE